MVGLKARRLYQEWLPNTLIQDKRAFANIHRRLTGSLKANQLKGTYKTENFGN